MQSSQRGGIALRRSELPVGGGVPAAASLLVDARLFVSLKSLEPSQGALGVSPGIQGVWKERLSNQGSFANVLIAPSWGACRAQASPRDTVPWAERSPRPRIGELRGNCLPSTVSLQISLLPLPPLPGHTLVSAAGSALSSELPQRMMDTSA